MNTSQVRLSLALFGALLVAGCSQSAPTKTVLGNLPGQEPLPSDLPQVNASTYFAHAHLLERQGQLERAVVQYRKALALNPHFLGAQNRLGITLNKLGRNEEATEQFKRALVGRSELAYLHNNLGFSLYLEKKYDEAIASLQRALDLKPDFARAHMNYGLVLARLKKYDEAFEQLSQAGRPVDAYYNMGVILAEAEQYGEAAQYLEAALAANPNFDAARQQLLEVSRLAAEYEARQAVNQAMAADTPADSGQPVASETPTTPTEGAPASTPKQASAPDAVATSHTPSTYIEDVKVNTVPPQTEVTPPAEPVAPTMAAADSTPTPDPEPTRSAAAPTQASSTYIEDVEIETVPPQTAVAPPAEPVDKSEADAEPIDTLAPTGTTLAAAAPKSKPEPAHVAANRPEPTPAVTHTTSGLVIEDVVIDRPRNSRPPKTAARTSPAQAAPASNVNASGTSHSRGVEIVETIDITPGALNVRIPPGTDDCIVEQINETLAALDAKPGQAAPDIDQEKLIEMIDEALAALKDNPEEFDKLWLEVSCYVSAATKTDQQNAVGK